MSPFFQWKKSLWFWKVSNPITQVKRGRDLLVLRKYVFDWITPQPLIAVGANLIKNDNISYNMSYRHVCFAFICLSVYFVGCFVCFALFFFFCCFCCCYCCYLFYVFVLVCLWLILVDFVYFFSCFCLVFKLDSTIFWR